MEFNEYQKKALDTATYGDKYKIIYPAIGISNEAGEVLGKIKKWMRGDYGDGPISTEHKKAISDELGDVLWYIAVLAHDLDVNFDDVATKNIEKLKSRKERGVIKGDGDKR